MRSIFRRRLTSWKAVVAYVILILVFINEVVGAAANIDFVLTASGNSRLVLLWNFFATPRGNLLAILLAVAWITFLAFWPERKTSAESNPAQLAAPEPLHAQHITLPSPTPKASDTQETATEAEPEIECRGAKILRLYLNPNNNKLSDEEDANSLLSSIAVATFFRGTDESPDGWVEVRAHVYVLEISEGRKDEVYDAVWLNIQKSSVNFSKGDVYTLVIAACGKELIGMFAADFKTISRGMRRRCFAPKRTVISGKEFQIKVQLIGKRQGDVRLNKVFDFKLTLAPEPKIEEIKPDGILAAAPSENHAKRQYMIEHLRELIREGGAIESEPFGWIEITPENQERLSHQMKFPVRAERFLRQYYGVEAEWRIALFKEKGVAALEEFHRELIDS